VKPVVRAVVREMKCRGRFGNAEKRSAYVPTQKMAKKRVTRRRPGRLVP
jgi:hypothetical protein